MLSPFVAVLVGMTLNAAAYLCEIQRAGFLSIRQNELDAAKTLNFTLTQQVKYVILPHIMKVLFPPLSNHYIIMTLGTSMAAIFGVEELTGRAFNINSRSVGPTNIEGRSKMTIVTELESVEQVKKQLNKLINVIKIVELDPDNTIESEVLLMKVSINKESQTSVIEKANLSGAKSVDVGQDYAVFELTGTSKELKKFENLLKPFGIIEMIRGGRIAIQSNL